MKKLIYVASAPIEFDKPDGVAKKMIDQSNAFHKAGFEIDIIYRSKKSVYLYNVSTRTSRYLGRGFSFLSVLIQAKRLCSIYENVYIRYPKAEYFLISLIKSFKNSGAKVVVEIPTYPYHKEGINTIKGKLFAYLDKIYREELHKYVDRICTYSNDEVIFGIKTLRTINGIDFSRFVPDITITDSLDINLIAVSSMYIVHGYDRLIEGMYNYYNSGGRRNIYLHIVGSGDVDVEYKSLVLKRNLNGNVLFYGMKYGDELRNLYKGQHIGVNSLAIHRQDLLRESTLKTKEYAAMGLPIISSSYVDAFSKDGNSKYVFNIPPDETPVNIYSLIEYIDNLYNNVKVELIRAEIRRDGEMTCDMINTLKPIIDYYNNEI